MKIEIFDVEHGQCALVTADDGEHMLIDCGHNATSGWRPSEMLAARGIRRLNTLAISNCDEDHMNDLNNVAEYLLSDDRQMVNIRYLNHNSDITPDVIRQMKEPHALTNCMQWLCWLVPKFSGPGGVAFPTFGRGTCAMYRNTYPLALDDPTEPGFSNNMSLVTFLHLGDIHIVFPGDLEPKGWRLLLANANFQAELERVNVFVASHHGRSTGYFAEVFGFCNPKVIIVSDGSVGYNTQDGVYGQQHAIGLEMRSRGVGVTSSSSTAGGLALAGLIPNRPAAGDNPLGQLFAERAASDNTLTSLFSDMPVGNNPFSNAFTRAPRPAGGGTLGSSLEGTERRYVLTTRRDTNQQFPAIVIEQQPGQSATITTSNQWGVL
jgi:hypothetical protein